MTTITPEPATPDADPPQLSPRERFAETIRTDWPGGEYVADHVNDGPWLMVPTVLRDDARRPAINWLVEAIVDAYPPLRIPSEDGYAVVDAAIFTVPKFVSKLLHWNSDYDKDFWVLYDRTEEFEFATEPSSEDLLSAVTGLTGIALPGATIDTIVEHGTLENLLAYLRTLNADALDDDSYAEALNAYAATLLP